MKITKRQLRGLIREAMKSYAKMADDGSYYEDVIVMSPNGDSVLVDGELSLIHI